MSSQNKIIPINDSMTSGYDSFGRKLIRTKNGSQYRDDNTHAEVTHDMKNIVRIFKEEPKVEEVVREDEPVVKVKQTRKRKES